MLSEPKQVDFFVKVGDLLTDSEKIAQSKTVDIEGVTWYIQANAVVKDSTKLLCLSLACSIDWPNSVYGSVILDTEPGGQISDRFDSSHSSSTICTFKVPTIRNSKQPIRSIKVTARIQAEAPILLSIFEENMKDVGLSDVILKVEGHQLHVNRVILATASPVFRSMFFGHFSEADDQPSDNGATKKVIPLPAKDLSLLLEMLCTIYPPQIYITTTRAKFLLPLFMEYQISHMVKKCEHTLCQADIYDAHESKQIQPITSKSSAEIDEAMDHLLLCSLYKMEKLFHLAVSVLARYPSQDFEEHAVFGSMSLEVKHDVYRGRVLYLETKLSESSEETLELSA